MRRRSGSAPGMRPVRGSSPTAARRAPPSPGRDAANSSQLGLSGRSTFNFEDVGSSTFNFGDLEGSGGLGSSSKEDALERLFNAYDRDGDGIVSRDEYVKIEVEVGVAVGQKIDPRQVELMFNESLHRAYMQGEDQKSGGFSRRFFDKWKGTLPVEAIVQTAELIEMSCGPSGSGGKSSIFDWSSGFKAPKKMPRKGAHASGAGTTAVRQLHKKPTRPECPRCGQVIGKKTLREYIDLFMSAEVASPPASPRRLAKAVELVSMSAEIAWLAQELRDLIMQRKAADSLSINFLSAEELSLRERMQTLSSRRQESLRGKLVLRGTVSSAGRHLADVSIDVSLNGKLLASVSSDRRGVFEQRIAAEPGSRFVVTAEKAGFAASSTHVGGGGVKHIGLELLQLSIQGNFLAQPEEKSTMKFEDEASGATFEVPIGGLVKDGLPFEGEAQFDAAIPDMTSPDGVAGMPPLIGKTLGGAATAMQSVGAVFTNLTDASDGKRLELTDSGIHCTLPSAAPLSQQPPSLWQHDAQRGEWQQTQEPLYVNGLELPVPDPDEKLNIPDEVSKAEAIQQPELPEPSETKPTCICGKMAKQTIMPYVHASGLEHANPPQHLFAVAEEGGEHPFPYLIDSGSPEVSQDKAQASARRISRHPEVVLSHMFGEVGNALGWEDQRGHRGAGELDHPGSDREGAASRLLPQLRCIIEWLLSRARAVDTATGENVSDIAPAAVQLAVLEKLARIFMTQDGFSIRPEGPTHAELRGLLENQGGNIAEALFDAMREQTLRDRVAMVWDMVQGKLNYTDVERALENNDGDPKAAAKELVQDPRNLKQLLLYYAKEAGLYGMFRPTSSQLERALAPLMDRALAAAKKAYDSEDMSEFCGECGFIAYEAFSVTVGDSIRAWHKTLTEAAKTNTYSFDIRRIGWTNCDCSTPKMCTMLGSFSEAFATRVSAVGLDYRGIDFATDVEPDGSFSIMPLAGANFKLAAHKGDGGIPHTFGPFSGQLWQVLHLGLLDTSDHPVKEESRPIVDVAQIDILLPALPFPRAQVDRCTCGFEVHYEEEEYDGPYEEAF